ncbi:MAG: hypothetical protein Q7K65_05295 [Candidatus Buchananbacteria bacterium]|nr:hypothetical protein [Candidatus Buchananbacteria bacterium]
MKENNNFAVNKVNESKLIHMGSPDSYL